MQQTEIARLLPTVFQRTIPSAGPLRHLLDVMEDLQQPSQDIIDNVDSYFDPYRAPVDFVPLLARWLDLDWLMVEQPDDPLPHDFVPLASGTGRLRELVSSAVALSKVRGTTAGLVRFLETATGVRGFEVLENVSSDGTQRPFHLLVRVPEGAKTYAAMIRRILETQKPAYTTYALEFPTSEEEGHG